MKPRGFTIPEVLVSMAIFSLLGLVAYGFIRMATDVELRVSGHEDAALQLKKASRYLQKDLQVTNFSKTLVVKVPASLPGGAFDSSAVCLLSSAANGTGDMAIKPDGSAYWQRNIIYYAVVPQGDTCSGGPDADGIDDRCPHKVLIRKIIDSGPVTEPTGNPLSDEEALLTSLSPYLTRPTASLDLTAMTSEPNVTSVTLLARGLINMKIAREPDATNSPTEIQVTMKSLNVAHSSHSIAIGIAPLSNDQDTLTETLSIFPRN